MQEHKTPKTANTLITFQVTGHLNESLRSTAWSERKSLSELIRELCSHGLKQRSADLQQVSK